jgi:glycerol uptake facilitator-like aquaporin
VAGKITRSKGLAYWVAQLLGAAAAGYALAYFSTTWDRPCPPLGEGVDVVRARPGGDHDGGLLLAVFMPPDPRRPKIGGLAIGLAVTVGILLGGSLTGAAMNPARWFGPALAAGDFANWYVWWVGPFVGAIVVALLYRYLFAPPEQA